MSSDSTETFSASASVRGPLARFALSSAGAFRLRIAIFAFFSALVLLDSLFLIVCYVTVDFFGWLNNPFFGWVRQCAWIAWALYFPTLAAAILSMDTGQNAARSRRLTAFFVVAQIAAGALLYFTTGRKVDFGLALLYGPDVRLPEGNILTYVQAVACLTPLLWMSVIQLAAAWKNASRDKVSAQLRLSPFLLAGSSVFLLYSCTAWVRLTATGQRPAVQALLISLIAHLAAFLLIFLTLEWIRIAANRFPDPGVAQFALRCAAGWLLLAIVLRKVLFPLFGFNTHEADLHAALFALAAILCGAALWLKITEYRSVTPARNSSESFRLNPVAGRALVLMAGLGFFYVFAVRLARIDWERAIGSLAAMGTALLLFAFYWLSRRRARACSTAVLICLTVAAAGSIWKVRSLTVSAPDTIWAREAQQYADYDASFFVIQQALKPVVQDEKYREFYAFLERHSNIREAIAPPEVTLTGATLSRGQEAPPNIFVLVIDGLRRDYVAPFNPGVDFTPNFQAFAREGVAFENAWTPYAGTILAELGIWAGHQQVQKIYPDIHPRVSNLQRMLDVDGYESYVSYDDILHDLVPPGGSVIALNSGVTHWKENEFRSVTREFEDDLLKRGNPGRPVFLYAQPQDVHSLSLTLHNRQVAVRHRPGFNDQYASAVEDIDRIFGDFLQFLKDHQLYENSIVILTADHGESLGEVGRQGHVASVTPEIIRIPLIVHLPGRIQSRMVWDAKRFASLHDLTPTLYYLLGHRPLKSGPMLGRPLFTLTREEQAATPEHFLVMSSYVAVFGSLSGDQKSLFMVDANLHRNYYYTLHDDPRAFHNRITAAIRDRYEPILRQDLEEIDRLYRRESSR